MRVARVYRRLNIIANLLRLVYTRGMKKATQQKRNGGGSPFEAFLRDAGYKVTPVRLALLGVFQKTKKPISVEVLWRKIGKKKADQATVYRAVNDLENGGLLRRVHIGHTHAHYELAQDHHHHIICTSCGTIEDVPECDIKNIEKRALKSTRLFTMVNAHALELFGQCKKCVA